MTGIVVVVIAVFFGVGSFAKYKADTTQERPTAPASAPPTAPGPDPKSSPEKPKDAPLDARGLLRPLGLLRRFLGPEPMFRPEGNPDNAPPTSFESAVQAAVKKETAKAASPREKAATPEDKALLNGREPTAQDQAAIRKVVELLGKQGIQSTVVVATLPDWVDSSLQWTFDPMLDAIQMSAARMGYLLTAFDLPDSRGTSTEVTTPEKTARSQRRIHENVPGGLLFRRVTPPSENDPAKVELLLILLVGETTTDGVHARALARALDFALIWNQGAATQKVSGPSPEHGAATLRPGGVAILGPTYSGSVLSLQRGLNAAAIRNHREVVPEAGVWFKVVTPSASNSDNPFYLDQRGVSTFGSVSRSDSETLGALAHYLGGINEEWRCGDGVALLVESDTTWGRGFFDNEVSATESESKPKTKPKQCQDCRSGKGEYQPLPCATYVAFPLHISRLRSEAQHSSAKADVPLPDSAVVRLDLDEPGSAVDRISPATPALTAATVELMVSSLFRAIDDRRFTAIGVLATDKRDHVFLAQEIAAHRPNVLPFTIESSLLYLHPDVRSYVRGTLIASTYSLSTRAQKLTNPALARQFTQQFGSNQAHGAYNVLALLLGEPDKMLDYRAPKGPGEKLSKDRSPSVWISVAAKGGLLPLAASSGANCRTPFAQTDTASLPTASAAPYVSCNDTPGPGSEATREPEFRYLENPPLLVILAAVLFLSLVAHQGIVLWNTRKETVGSVVGSDAMLVVLADRERQASGAALRAASLAIGLWVIKMEAIFIADVQGYSLATFQVIYEILAAAVIAYVAWDVIARFWYAADANTRKTSFGGQGLLIARIAAIVFAALALVWASASDEPGELAQLADIYRHPQTLNLLLVIALLIAVCADLIPAGWNGLADRVAQWRRIPVLLGLAALICLGAHLSLDRWDPVEAILYFDRNVMVGDLASSATFILLSAAALYWWGAWNLRRVKLLRLPETEIGIGAFLEGRADSAEIDSRRLRQPALTMGYAIMIPIGAVLAVAYGYRYASSIEQHRFDAFLYLASACILTAMCHTLAHSVSLGRIVLSLLQAVGRHPAVRVVKRLAAEPFEWRITYTEPHRPDLEPLVRRVERIRGTLAEWCVQDTEIVLPGGAGGLDQLHAQMSDFVEQMRFEAPAGDPNKMAQRLPDASDWRALDELVGTFYRYLCRTKWLSSFPKASLSKSCRAALDQMEIVVVFHAAIILRDLLTRLVTGFSAVAGGLLLLLAGHLLYTFQGRVYWLGLDAIAVALTALFAIRRLVALERDPVLSTLWATTPGKIPLFGKLTWRVGIYLLLALITLLAAFFPELGGQLGKWVEPARQLVPL